MESLTDLTTSEISTSEIRDVNPQILALADDLGFRSIISGNRFNKRYSERATAIMDYDLLKSANWGVHLNLLDEMIGEISESTKPGTAGAPLLELSRGNIKLIKNPRRSGQSKVFFLEDNGLRKAVVKIHRNESGLSDTSQNYIYEALQLRVFENNIQSGNIKTLLRVPKVYFASQSILIEEFIPGVYPTNDDSGHIFKFERESRFFIGGAKRPTSAQYHLWLAVEMDVEDDSTELIDKINYSNFIQTSEGVIYCIDPFRRKTQNDPRF